MVRLARIFSSLVTSGTPSTLAVAPISRSAGSLGYVSGNCAATETISLLNSFTSTPKTKSSTVAWTVPNDSSLPRAIAFASSHKVIDAIATPSLHLLSTIASVAGWESFSGSVKDQIRTCVSSRITARIPKPLEDRSESQCRRRFSLFPEDARTTGLEYCRPGAPV